MIFYLYSKEIQRNCIVEQMATVLHSQEDLTNSVSGCDCNTFAFIL